MKINFFDNQSDLSLSKRQITKTVKLLLSYLSVLSNEASIYFVAKEEISNLHEKFFNDPTPTDCISFPIDPPDSKGFLGEIFVCPQVAKEYAEEHHISIYEELLLYIIHGFLHLIGYDDIEDHEKKRMRQKEKECMNFLKKEIDIRTLC